ncbi:hypothetical protein LX36DRAFT_159119 [Colletotrichum falcatum]|nr:hypothetical protein LX36DRAFT_159119 [Colletotrichum falcatum]
MRGRSSSPLQQRTSKVKKSQSCGHALEAECPPALACARGRGHVAERNGFADGAVPVAPCRAEAIRERRARADANLDGEKEKRKRKKRPQRAEHAPVTGPRGHCQSTLGNKTKKGVRQASPETRVHVAVSLQRDLDVDMACFFFFYTKLFFLRHSTRGVYICTLSRQAETTQQTPRQVDSFCGKNTGLASPPPPPPWDNFGMRQDAGDQKHF